MNDIQNSKQLLKKALLRFSGSPLRNSASAYKKGVSDMFDIDSSKKGLSGLADKAIGTFAIGAPAASAAYSVNKVNSQNPGVSDSKRTKDNISTGARSGFVDGSTAALLHRSKDSLGRGGAGLLKRMAIYGGTSALVGSSIGAGVSATNYSRSKNKTDKKKPGK